MEHAKHNWMWPASRKPNFNNPIMFPAMNNSLYGDSWEEQAFAEDAAGALGGCVWPPRSYSCSFCRREFRSAQALGGHMNVHRRDRARLKQSSSSPILCSADQGVSHHHHHHHITHAPVNPCSSDQIRTFLYTSPNPEYTDAGPLISPVSSVIRASSPPPEDLSNLCFFTATKKHDEGNAAIWSCNQPFSPEKRNWALDSARKEEKKPEKGDCVTQELSMGLNLVQVACRKRSNPSNGDDEEVGSCKRRRIQEKPSNLFLKSTDRCLLPQSEMLKICSGSSEEVLDLELRLGDAPKVK